MAMVQLTRLPGKKKKECAMMDQTITAKTAVFPLEHRVQNRHLLTQVLLAGVIGDAIVVFLALAFSSWLRFETSLVHLGVMAHVIHWTDYSGHVAFGTLLFILLLPYRQLYDLHRILRLRQTVPVIIKSALTWLVAYMAFSWLLRSEEEISRIYVIIAFVITTTMFTLWRYLLCRIVRSESVARRLQQHILFVGWSGHATSLAQAIAADDRLFYKIAGYIPSGRPGNASRPDVFVRKLGDRDNMAEVLQEHPVDMVVLADMNLSTDETVALANLCEKEMVDFKVIPSCFQILLPCLQMQTVSGMPVLGISYLPFDSPLNAMLKQLVDLAGGLVGFILSAPIIVFFGILVYLESPGPIIYRQRRLGQAGRPFWIYKIRSMKMNAESDGKVGWTVKDDPRRLRIGAFMRRWNFDELPQFCNVIKGEMSLVGPRPERPELIGIFKEEIPHYNARHNIKPGITGWAQVNGFRGDTDLTKRVHCDLYYIENWSLFLDFQIMLMTFFRQKNAV
jgi:exopolysaccharide biosynthesis polyprenyl glycosylphosphotransferase